MFLRFQSVRSLLARGLAAAVLLLAATAARAQGPLFDYINNGDKTFAWEIDNSRKNANGYTTHNVTLTSQEWRGLTWKHTLTIIRPDELVNPEIAVLLISGGSNLGSGEPNVRPSPETMILAQVAVQLKSVAAVLYQVPNQPILGGKSEDAAIAHTLDQALKTGEMDWPLLFPMTKSAIRAMDAVQQIAREKEDLGITKFMVTGASKRGWTTWLTGAADPRVIAIAPMVIDNLNMGKQMPHQLASWGRFSEMIHDYSALDLPNRANEPEVAKVMGTVDPYGYLDRLEMPKLILNGTNDPYWVADASRFYFDDLKGERYSNYTPNAGHGLGDGAPQAIAGFFSMVREGRPRPKMNWEISPEGDDAKLVLQIDQEPAEVRLWSATNPEGRDLRKREWAYVTVPRGENGAWTASVDVPESGYTGFYAEARYPLPNGDHFGLTTTLRVLGDGEEIAYSGDSGTPSPTAQAAVPAPAAPGIVSHQVIQRDADGKGVAVLRGELPLGVDDVTVTVTSHGLPVAGLADADITLDGKSWTAKVASIPTGGPYRFEAKVTGGGGMAVIHNVVDDVYVGDLWVLAGQSNMEGVGRLENATDPSGMVQMFDMTDNWRLATEPLHERPIAVHPIYWNVGKPEEAKRMTDEEGAKWRARRDRGAGLGLPFAKSLSSRTGVPIGLIPCAYGGTSMDQWSPSLRERGSSSLYGAMMNRIASAGGKVAGVLWYQGESDANKAAADAYYDKFRNFIGAIRSDLGDDDLPFYYVQIGRFVVKGNRGADWDRIQDLQRRLALEVPHTGVVPAVDLALDDLIHADTAGLGELGRRLANLAGMDLFGDLPAFRRMRSGPRFASAALDGGDKRRVRVTCENVNGSLVAEGRPAGFSCTIGGDPDSSPQPFKTMLDPEDPNSVLLLFQDDLGEDVELWYGRGLDPYCNIRDEEGMALPAAGPVRIGR